MRDQRGFVLTMVLITFLIIEVIGVGVLSVVMSDLHGAAASQMAVQAVHVAEAGLNYGVAQMVSQATGAVPADEGYAGEPDDVALAAADGSTAGTFRLIVRCAYPRDAIPPSCQDDPVTAAIDERNLRIITSSGYVPGRPGRARRQIEALVRRYAPGPGDAPAYGVCGREGVELGPGTTITGDIGSNGEVRIDGPRRMPGTVRERLPRSPLLPPGVVSASPAAPGEDLNGLYTWRVTFVDTRGEESGGGPPTRPVLLTGQFGSLTNLPVGDASILRRRIYRSLQGAVRGPWFLVAELADNVTREYTDFQRDESLGRRMPGPIFGAVTAAGAVTCTHGCSSQVDGEIRSGVRDVVCPAFLPPPCQPGAEPAPEAIIQSSVDETVRFSALRVEEGGLFTIQTLPDPKARLHVHVQDITLEPDAALAVTGLSTVYFHVAGRFRLGPGAMFGVEDSSGRLVRPSDRVQVLSCAQDSAFAATGAGSVRWERANRVSAVVFAPGANILINRADAFSGAIFGRFVRIQQSPTFLADPTEGFASDRLGARPSAFHYLVRWYDNPTPTP